MWFQSGDNISIEKLRRKLDEFAWQFCPVYKDFNLRYHWSILQAEYATDIVFKQQDDLQQIYGEMVSTAIHSVKPENIATFPGRKLDERYQGEIGNNYNVRIEGSRIRHSMGAVSIKMYDKFGKILRIETTANDISFFKHFPRNPILAEACFRGGFIDSWGSGIMKIIESCKLAGLPTPTLEEDGGGFKV